MGHFERPPTENSENMDRRPEYEEAGLTDQEQKVHEKFLKNLKEFNKSISSFWGLVRIGLPFTKKGESLTDEENALISSANEKLLKLQQGKRAMGENI